MTNDPDFDEYTARRQADAEPVSLAQPRAEDAGNASVRQMVAHLARRADETISKALNEKLGRSDWTFDEMRGRLHVVGSHHAGETFYFDGEPFLWLGAPKISHDEASGTISVDREWRAL